MPTFDHRQFGAVLSAGALLWGATVATADPATGAWKISDKISPLTNAETYAASLDSPDPLLNQLGQEDHATLVMRCREGVPAFYIAWPQVLSHDVDSVRLELPETVALEKIDNGPIVSDLWVISNGGTSAGSFDAVGAPRMIASVAHAKRLVVRLTGTSPQDATFDLAGVDIVARTVAEKCNIPRPMIDPGYADRGAEISAKMTKPQGATLEAAKTFLVSKGYVIAKESDSSLTTAPMVGRISMREGSCGSMFAIPYLMDGRTRTKVTVYVDVQGDRLAVSTAIAGAMRVVGTQEKQLTCKSSGVIEQQVVDAAIG